MKLEELVAGKKEEEELSLDGTTIPVSALKRIIEEGYVHVKPYRGNGTFFLWGKTCSACLSRENLLKRA